MLPRAVCTAWTTEWLIQPDYLPEETSLYLLGGSGKLTLYNLFLTPEGYDTPPNGNNDHDFHSCEFPAPGSYNGLQ